MNDPKKLNRANRPGKRTPKDVPIDSLDGAIVTLRPMTAGKQDELERAQPRLADGQMQDHHAYMRSVISETVTGDDGQPVWDADELKNGIDTAVFWELWDVVSTFLGLKRKAAEKN